MRTHLRTLFTASAAVITLALFLTLTACQSTLQFAADVTGTDVVSENVRANAYKAAKVALVAWGGAVSPECENGTLPPEQCVGGIQKLIYTYAKLPPCVDGQFYICRYEGPWQRIKKIEGQTSAALLAAKPLIEAGTDDVALLMSIPALVHDAKAAIDGEMKGTK